MAYISKITPLGSNESYDLKAAQLVTARTLTIGSTGKTFDGSGNVSWSHAEIGATVSNAWTAGTTAGPTIKTTVNGVAGTAVAIPSASKTASGVVTTGTQNFVGRKGFGFLNRYGYDDSGTASQWACDTYCYNAAGTQVAEYWYDCGNATNITKGQWYFTEYSPQSTADTTTTGKREAYYLPNVTSGLTSNVNYAILTSKNAVTIAQGGTGATTAAGARTNLAVPYMVTESYPALLPTDATNNWIKIGTTNDSYGLLPSQAGGAGSGHNYLGTSYWYWKYAYIDEIYGHLNGAAAYLTTPNTAGFKTDQYGNFQHQSTTTTDYWTIKSNAGTEKFKVNFENGDTNVNGTIYITPTLSNWREGIRIKPYGSWSTIVLGGNDLTADSGTSANSWSIHNSNGSFYITRNGSSTGTAQLACVSNKWSISGNITSPSASSSWILGQNSTNAAYNVGDATNTNGYWPWMRQTNTSSAKWFSFGTLGTRFYWIGSATSHTENSYDQGMSFDIANGYLQGCSRVYGAVWNDYAEYRITKDKIEPGRCVIETGKDDLVLSTERLQPGAEIVSDTFGFAIGETDEAKTPIATTGRVLAYIYEGREAALAAIGKPVCSGPDGTVSIMTDEEYQKYGYCAIGTISAVPDYEEWGTGNVKVNNRIWIRIR